MFPLLFTFIRIDHFIRPISCDGNRQRDILETKHNFTIFVVCLNLLSIGAQFSNVNRFELNPKSISPNNVSYTAAQIPKADVVEIERIRNISSNYFFIVKLVLTPGYATRLC